VTPRNGERGSQVRGRTAGRRELRRPLQAPRRLSHSPRTTRKAMACGDLARVRMKRLPPIAASRVVDWQEITETDSAVMLSPIRSTRVLWIRPSADDGSAPASRLNVVPLMCSSFLKTASSPASAGFLFGLGAEGVGLGADPSAIAWHLVAIGSRPCAEAVT
jgi:hypothetical protein